MTPLISPKSLTSIFTAAALALGTVSVATITLAPDAAFAKNDKGNGNGNGGGRGGGSDKSDRGGKGHDKAERGSGKSGGSKGNGNRSAKANGKHDPAGAWRELKKEFKKNGSSNASRNTKGPKTLAEAGRQFQKDLKSLFTGTTDTQRPKRATVKRATLVDTSPRPAPRFTRVRGAPEGNLPKDRVRTRDPLVSAITDPGGSPKLRNLSASGAAAAAFANASANSNVGKIATYQTAASEYYALRDELAEARRELRAFNGAYEGRTSAEIEIDIASLDPTTPEYAETLATLEDELARAETFETERQDLKEDVIDLRRETYDALESAETAFFDASKGRELTPDALGDFHDNLGLPDPTASRAYNDPNLTEPQRRDMLVAPGSEGTVASARTQGARSKDRLRDPLVAAITAPDGSDKLRNLNASRAAAAAFANASPNSNVGKIATYQEAATEYYDTREDLMDARSALRDFDQSYDGRGSDEVLQDIADLDPTIPGYEETLSALEQELAVAEAFEDERDGLLDGVRDVRRDFLIAGKEAEAAFFDASKGGALTVSALNDLHANLGLPTAADR
ncbi:hypothetical protein [Tropicimonas sp. S265A]|uniref:hypothetical protein n=1 Tax=Tropicimonas sp. S265A TaxID=3415134 RepID=UPI003C7A9A7F